MPIKSYGVWAGKPTSYTAEFEGDDDRSPHLTLHFSDNTSSSKTAAINVKSLSRDSRLVYWVDRNFTHPITTALKDLDQGFHYVPDRDGSNAHLALDYQRTEPKLLDFSEGWLLPHDIPGPDNDILDELIPTVKRAIAGDGDTVYIFGSSFHTGIHDVHMNQGSLPKFDNGVGVDGALVFRFAGDGAGAEDHFEAVFLAFASQSVPTDDETGLAGDDARPLADIARDGVSNGN